MPRHVHQDTKTYAQRDSCLPLLVRLSASQSVLDCCCALQFRPPNNGKTAVIPQQLPRYLFSTPSNRSSREYLDIVASARRSGHEGFQQGTPPVALASDSVSHYYELVLQRSDLSRAPREITSQTARGHQPLFPCFCSTSTYDHVKRNPYGLVDKMKEEVLLSL